jgi:hypothetical protein
MCSNQSRPLTTAHGSTSLTALSLVPSEAEGLPKGGREPFGPEDLRTEGRKSNGDRKGAGNPLQRSFHHEP